MLNPDEKLKIYTELWKSENPIKTQKLMAYFVSQSILALAASKNSLSLLLFSLLGCAWSAWWLFCIGRTVAYQGLWKAKAVKIDPELFPSEVDKATLPWYGRVNARVILLAPPVVGAIVWFVFFLYSLIALARDTQQ
jgi:hypothetical protein